MSEMDAYRSLYIAESRENHEQIVKNLLILEAGPDEGAIAEIFRAAHSLKGMSASMGFSPMERLCHAMEDIFQQVRSGGLGVSPALTDLLLQAADEIEIMLDDIEHGGTGEHPGLDDRIAALRGWTGGGTPAESPAAAAPALKVPEAAGAEGSAGGERFRIIVSLCETCDKNLRGMLLLQNLDEIGRVITSTPPREVIEDGKFDGKMELVVETSAGEDALRTVAQGTDVEAVTVVPAGIAGPEPAPAARAEALSPAEEDRPKKSEKREVRNVRVDIARLDQMMNLVEDLVINRGRLAQIVQGSQNRELDETMNMVGRSVSDLQNLMMQIRMIPLNHIFNRFPRTVRDLANREGKEVEFVMEGGETELDRSVMDGLNDPLMHLIRNAIDHGIERPEVRTAAGKTPKGHLRLSARRESENVIIVIEDDGGGIDPARIVAKAIDRDILKPEAAQALTPEQIYALLFLPGFSTAEKITDVSGRGVGLDVVKTTIDSLKGSIKTDSTLGKGTRFELVLPPTMAIVNVMMVRTNNRRFAIPVSNIVEVASLIRGDVHRIGTIETILLRDEVLPLERMVDMFGANPKADNLVVVQNPLGKRAIAVDQIEGQQEVVIKPLGQAAGSIRGISGVTIPGDGEVVPVIDTNAIGKEG